MAEKRTIDLEINDNSKTLKQQYKEAILELQKMAATYGETSEEAKKAAKNAADLKDQIEDSNDLLQSYKGEGTFLAMNKALGAVAGGFSALQGGMALLGVEGEAVEQTMLKVQAAMALSQGLEAMEDAGRSFTVLGNKVKDLLVKLGVLTVSKQADAVATTEQAAATTANITATEAQAAANQTAGASFKTMGNSAKLSLNGIKGAIAATGIGVLLIALGAMVAYWDDIKAAVNGVSREQEQLVETERQQAELAQKSLEAFDLEAKALKLAGKSELEINKLRAQRLKTAVIEQEQYIAAMKGKKKMELEAEKRNLGILKTVARVGLELATFGLRLLATPIDAAISTVNSLSEALGFGKITTFNLNKEISKMNEWAATGLGKMVFNPDKVKEEGDKTIEEAESKLNTLKGQVLDNELAMKQAKENAAKGNADKQKEINNDLTAYLDAQEKDRQARITDAQEKELQELANKFDEMTLLADKAGQDDTEITKQYQADIIAIKQKYRQIEIAKQEEANKIASDLEKKRQAEFLLQIEQLDEANYQAKLSDYDRELGLLREKYFAMEEMAKGNAEAEATIREAKEKELAEINIKYDKENQERKRAELERNVGFVKEGLTIIQNLTELFGKKGVQSARKAFKIKKAAQIASALIDTYMNATAAYGSQFLPIPDPTSPIRGGIAAGLAVAAGLVNVAKIGAQKFEGGSASAGGGGGGGGSVPTMSGGAPSQAPSFNVVGNNGLNQLAQLQQQPTQAFVVSGEVTSAQSLDRNRIQNATL